MGGVAIAIFSADDGLAPNSWTLGLGGSQSIYRPGRDHSSKRESKSTNSKPYES